MNHLGLFAKFWQPGTVKTRLAATIGDIAACEIYHAFLFHLLTRLRNAADTRSVVFSPAEQETTIRESVSPEWELHLQSTGDLGHRMKSFFEQQFATSMDTQLANISAGHVPQHSKVVVIGADCPQLTPFDIEAAYDALDKADVVIGPSTDGGYYLLGMRDKCFNIFANIQWSTSSVFKQTVRHLNHHGIEYRTLTPLTDVDVFDNLLDLISDLECRQLEGILDPLDAGLFKRVTEVVNRGTASEPT